MLSDKPQEINEHNWYYEDPDDIDLCHESFDNEGNYIDTEHIKIPWKMLEISLLRRNNARSKADSCRSKFSHSK